MEEEATSKREWIESPESKREKEMVGISLDFSDPSRPHPSLLDEEENESDEWDGCSEDEFDVDVVGLESFDGEFMPVEQPAEPLDEDQPVSWPIPECSFLSVSGAALLEDDIWKEPIGRSCRGRPDPLVAAESRINFNGKDEGMWKDWFSRSFRKRPEPSVVHKESTNFHMKDEGIWKDWFAPSFRKRAEPAVAKEDSTDEQPPAKALHRRRHHRITRDPTTFPSSRGHPANVFQVFQQCKEFEF